jgi:adenosine deaminase
MHLISTLGSSFAVVPEAYLMGNGDEKYARVTVLTTSNVEESIAKVIAWFGDHAPNVGLRILTIDDLPDIRCFDDHARYEEALFRVYFDCLEKCHERATLHLCLAGGFKTMSSSAHQTADLLGCGSLFHITSPFGERFDDHEAILRGIQDKNINLIALGSRPGWPTIRGLAGESPGIPQESGCLQITKTSLRDKILTRLREANQLAQSQDELASLPFPILATWTPSARDWLQQPLDPSSPTDQEWVANLPKIELHCHLGGFATHGPLLDQVRTAATNPDKLPPLPTAESKEARDITHPAGWPHPSDPCGLEVYRHLGDLNGSALLKDPGCLKKQIHLLYAHFQAQNVRYAEVRCSPGNYASPGRSSWQVLEDIIDHFNAAMAGAPEGSCHVNLIIIGTRQPQGDFRTQLIRHLMLAVTAAEHFTDAKSCRVVGVDLAGYEDKTTRSHYFRADFLPIHRAGLSLTVHAGENDDAEAIWSAIFDLSTMRLGHALSLGENPALLQSVAHRRIAVEMCPYANLQIKGYPLDQEARSASPGQRYPLKTYLDANILVTVNTDNIGISAASLTANLLLASRLCPDLTRLDFLRLLRHAADSAFGPTSLRQNLIETLQKSLPSPI